MYYVYHIPGKKIGVTKNPEYRITKQQGYDVGEFEILHQSEDIDLVSNLEVSLQELYGYKVDTTLYKDLKPNKTELNSMKINVTEQTTTFPCPVNKLKGQLMDNLDVHWNTEHGVLSISTSTTQWILDNVKASYFNKERCFVYNKAFAKFIGEQTTEFYNEKENENEQEPEEAPNVYDLIRQWASARGIYKSGDVNTQYVKLMEEAGELAEAILKEDEDETIDAIGDMMVVLTNLAAMKGYKVEECIVTAYEVIKDRQGEMVNGTFVKN